MDTIHQIIAIFRKLVIEIKDDALIKEKIDKHFTESVCLSDEFVKHNNDYKHIISSLSTHIDLLENNYKYQPKRIWV